MDKIKIVIVDDVEETRGNIKTLLSFDQRFEVIGEAGNGSDAVSMAANLKPDIMLMDINMPGMDGIKATEEITQNIPETNVVIMSVQSEPEYLKKAMSAGAREYLSKPFSSEDLINVITKIHEKEHKRRELSFPIKDDEVVKSRIITVFSTKGGVGKTTLASNLAAGIARLTRKKVALVDLDLQFGDIAIMLNVSVKNTISDLIKEINQLDDELLDDYMVTHFSGVKVLPAPVKPEYAEYITAMHVEKILKILKRNYHYIVIDTSASFHETVLTSLDMSDDILLISTLDLPTIKNVKSGLDVMESLRYPEDKVHVVLNKASEQFGVKFKDFENTLKHKIWAYIPEDSHTVITSANKGFPFVMARTETKVARAVIEIADELTRENGLKSPENNIIKRILKL